MFWVAFLAIDHVDVLIAWLLMQAEVLPAMPICTRVLPGCISDEQERNAR